MSRTLDEALSISPIKTALIEAHPDYPNTLIRLLSDGSARGLQVQAKGFAYPNLTPEEFQEFKASVDERKFNCRPLDR